jgi:hypothetical protein
MFLPGPFLERQGFNLLSGLPQEGVDLLGALLPDVAA